MKVAAFVIGIALVASACSEVSAAGDGRSISRVNGSVTANAGESYDTLSAVNGSLRVGRGASADTATTVNGQIVLEDEVKVGSTSTVNGSLTIGEGAVIAREASTVNGSVKLANRAQVGGDVSTVSGSISLTGAEVTGMLRTVNGNIDLTEGARVRAGIHVRKPNRTGWNWKEEEPVKVHICSTCVVDGELRFERPVELRVDSGGKIGKVIGDEVTRR